MNYDEHFNQSAELRAAHWNQLGTLHEDVITHLINPAFMGGPSWPSLRQAFVRIDTPSGVILATDGLSDPYSDFNDNPEHREYNGIGCELYIECAGDMGDFDALKNAWQFQLLYQAAQLAANNPNIVSMLDEYGYVSTELYDCGVPESFENEEGRAGVLLGLRSERVPGHLRLSLENIRLVNVTLLTLAELQHIHNNGTDGRNEVARLLEAVNTVSIPELNRASVI